MTVNSNERRKCYALMRRYGLKCSEFLSGHAWHMPDIGREQWFVYINEDSDMRIATTVDLKPPFKVLREEIDWRIVTSNTSTVYNYEDFEYILTNLIAAYNICKKELRELLIREAAHGYET